MHFPAQNLLLLPTAATKDCACWKAFQERQRLQRQAKKKYLKFYGALCAQSLHNHCRTVPPSGVVASCPLLSRRRRPSPRTAAENLLCPFAALAV